MPPLQRKPRTSARKHIARVIVLVAVLNLVYTVVTRAADLPAVFRGALRCAPRRCGAGLCTPAAHAQHMTCNVAAARGSVSGQSGRLAIARAVCGTIYAATCDPLLPSLDRLPYAAAASSKTEPSGQQEPAPKWTPPPAAHTGGAQCAAGYAAEPRRRQGRHLRGRQGAHKLKLYRKL